MSQLRSNYSKALGVGMTYSEWAGWRNGRRMVWRQTGYTEDMVRNKLENANLLFSRIQVTEVNRQGKMNHYVRVYR